MRHAKKDRLKPWEREMVTEHESDGEEEKHNSSKLRQYRGSVGGRRGG